MKRDSILCPRCHGSGHPPVLQSNRLRQAAAMNYKCLACRGTGQIKRSHWTLMLAAQKLAHRALEMNR